jgi:glycosyltransferase involved in cell wall biosynthesis
VTPPRGAPDGPPTITVVIATRDRPELLRRALSAALSQAHPGHLEAVVVFDRSDPEDVAPPGSAADRTVRVIRNTRTPGLAGARNSGVLAATGDLVAFCDDDDVWLPGKLRRQLEAWDAHPDAIAVATGITIVTEHGRIERIGPPRTSFEDLLRSRVSELHPSSLLFRREDLLGRVGLVDERLPASYGEDYELLLRAARHGEVLSVADPLVDIHWNRPSFFEGRWDAIAAGLTYILERTPEFAEVPRGSARVEGQVAFAHAARRRRREALRWAGRSLRHDPRQLRALGAIAVALRLADPERLVRRVQRSGRGL